MKYLLIYSNIVFFNKPWTPDGQICNIQWAYPLSGCQRNWPTCTYNLGPSTVREVGQYAISVIRSHGPTRWQSGGPIHCHGFQPVGQHTENLGLSTVEEWANVLLLRLDLISPLADAVWADTLLTSHLWWANMHVEYWPMCHQCNSDAMGPLISRVSQSLEICVGPHLTYIWWANPLTGYKW